MQTKDRKRNTYGLFAIKILNEE